MTNKFSKKTISNFTRNVVLAFVMLFPVAAFSQGFTISGNQLRDANGNNFIMKGFSIPTAWYNTDVNSNITNMRNNTGANCLRIVVTTSSPDSYWQTSVTNCIANKMVPMVELHDVTGSTDVSAPNRMAQFWASKAWFLTRADISKYILINIANEWGDWNIANSNQVAWRNAYQPAISTIRNAGINTTLVIDAPGWGQDLRGGNTVKAYAPALQSYDPRHNLLFSIHMYCDWGAGGSSNPATEIGNIKNAGIPLIVGEFGYQHDNGSGGVCDINESTIINTCQNKGVGWLAWSWKGNGSPVTYLDLSNNWAGTSLSGWGNTVVWGSNGTKTSSVASVFNGGGSGNGPIADGTYKITFRHSNLSLNVEGNSIANGGNVVQWNYNNGTNEQWYVKNLGGGQYSIKNVNSGKGLDVAGASTADGADINQWTYSGNNNQKWTMENVSGYYRIKNVNSGKCIDMPGSTMVAGTSISQYTCNGANNQSFYFTQLGTYAGRAASVQTVPLTDPVISKLSVYPNPSSGAFNLHAAESFSYTIFNAAGAVVEKGTGRDKAAVGNKLVSGIYIVEVKSVKGSKKFKLIKN